MSGEYHSSKHRRRRPWWRRSAVRKWLRRAFIGGSAVIVIAGVTLGIYRFLPKPTDVEHIKQAVIFLDKGKLESAAQELKTALQKKPESIDARWMLSDIYLKQHNGAAAFEQITRVQELGRQGEEVTFRLVRAMLMEKQFREALARLAFMKPAPGDPTVFLLRGQARIGLNRLDTAHAALAEAQRIDPDNPESYIGLATVALAQGDSDKAERLINAALDHAPRNALGLMLKGEIMMARRDAPEAEAAFKAVLDLEPYNLPARLALIQALLVQKKVPQANVHLTALLKKYPNHPNLNFLIAQREITHGMDLDSAEAALYQALKEAPRESSCLLLMGWVKLLKNETESALDYLTAYQEIMPGERAGTILLVDILFGTGQVSRAIEVLTHAVNLAPGNTELVTLLGTAYLRIGEYEKAKRLLSTAVSNAPDDSSVRTQFAVSLIVSGDIKEGVSELEVVVGDNPAYLRAEYLLALALYKAGNHDRALAIAASLGRKWPENPLPLILMGAIHEEKGDIGKAQEFYQKGLERDPGSILVKYNLARLSWNNGEIETARERFYSILLEQPEHLPTLMALAQIKLAENNLDEAVSLLEKAYQVNPKSLELGIKLADLYTRMGRLADALSAMETAARSASNNPDVLLALGRAQLRIGHVAAALTTFERLVNQLPESAEAHLAYAQAQLRSNNTRGASDSLKKALLLEPHNTRIMESRGQLLLTEGKPGEALGIAKEIQRIQPKHAEGYLLEGDVLMSRQQPDIAVAAYVSALESAREHRTIVKLQNAYRQAGDAVKADILLRDWLGEHPEDVHARVVLATAMMQEGKLDYAIREFEQALHYQPENGELHNNLAWLYGQTGNAQALASAKRAYELLPGHPEILDTYGWSLAQNNEPEQGLPLLKEAAKKSPENPWFRYHLAGALALTGQTQRARKELETIQSMQQDDIDPQVITRAIQDLE